MQEPACHGRKSAHPFSQPFGSRRNARSVSAAQPKMGCSDKRGLSMLFGLSLDSGPTLGRRSAARGCSYRHEAEGTYLGS